MRLQMKKLKSILLVLMALLLIAARVNPKFLPDWRVILLVGRCFHEGWAEGEGVSSALCSHSIC